MESLSKSVLVQAKKIISKGKDLFNFNMIRMEIYIAKVCQKKGAGLKFQVRRLKMQKEKSIVTTDGCEMKSWNLPSYFNIQGIPR